MKEYIDSIKPNYYDDFQCIGSECKNNCCAGWRVPLKEDEYRTLKETEKINTIFSDYLQESNDTYEIKMDEKGNCPFLTEEHLCFLQKNYGYKALSHTCAVYPRTYAVYLNVIEDHLLLSCEAVVKKILEQDVIMYESYKTPLSKYKESNCFEKVSEQDVENNPKGMFYFDIKILNCAILQCRKYTLNERLIILGIAIHTIQILHDKGRTQEINTYCDKFIETLEINSYQEMIGEYTPDYAIKYSCMSEILAKAPQDLFVKLVNKVGQKKQDIGYLLNSGIEEERKRYNTFEEANSIKIENLMVEIFSNNSSWLLKKNWSFWEEYGAGVIKVSIYRMFMAHSCESTKVEDLASIISSVSRVMDHTNVFAEGIKDLVNSNEENRLALMVALYI